MPPANNNSNTSSNFLSVPPPQTPRSISHRRSGSGSAFLPGSALGGGSGIGITPSFSFGLGFSPSFQFNSPRNISLLNSFSPHRFFQSSAELSKAVSGGSSLTASTIDQSNNNNNDVNNDKEKPTSNTESSSMHAPSIRTHKKKCSISTGDIFTSLTPPSSSKTNHNNRFLDSLTSSISSNSSNKIHNIPNTTNKHNHDDTSSNESTSNDIDIWSLSNDINSHNITVNLTSIYEDDVKTPRHHDASRQNNDDEADDQNVSTFLTPNKLLLNSKPPSTQNDNQQVNGTGHTQPSSQAPTRDENDTDEEEQDDLEEQDQLSNTNTNITADAGVYIKEEDKENCLQPPPLATATATPIMPKKIDFLADSVPSSTKTLKSFTSMPTPASHHVINKKKRRVVTSNDTSESPSKAIACQIDTIASPSKRRKSSLSALAKSPALVGGPSTFTPNNSQRGNASVGASGSTNGKHDPDQLPSNMVPRVWNADLDEMLLKSYAKFKVFKENQLIDSSTTLKNTSQNKILSRMLYNKTGVLRNSKQIASRLFRLTKTKMAGGSRAPLICQSTPTGNEFEDVTKTPYNSFNGGSFTPGGGFRQPGKSSSTSSSTTRGVATNDAIDKDLDRLLSTTPIDDVDFATTGSTNTNSTNIDHGSVRKEAAYSLQPKSFDIRYLSRPSSGSQSSHSSSCHNFTTLDTGFFSKTPLAVSSLKKKLKFNHTISQDFDRFSNAIKRNATPIWYVSSRLDLRRQHSQPDQGQKDEKVPYNIPQSLDLNGGDFESFLGIEVPVNKNVNDEGSGLHWKCTTYVYRNKHLLLKTTEAISGYINEDGDKYDLKVPFLKKFWSGMLTYLDNGASDTSELRKLFIMQVIHEDNEKISDGGSKEEHLHGCILHEFKAEGEHLGVSRLNILTLLDDDDHAAADDDDDNATVVAGSSPCRAASPRRNSELNHSPTSSALPLSRARRQSFQSGSQRASDLKIDISVANDILPDGSKDRGPLSAPIYNSKVLGKYTTPDHRRSYQQSMQSGSQTSTGYVFPATNGIKQQAPQSLPQSLAPPSGIPHGNISQTSNLYENQFFLQPSFKQISPLANRSTGSNGPHHSPDESSPFMVNSQLGTPSSIFTSTPAKPFVAHHPQEVRSVQRPLPPQASMSTPLLHQNTKPSLSNSSVKATNATAPMNFNGIDTRMNSMHNRASMVSDTYVMRNQNGHGGFMNGLNSGNVNTTDSSNQPESMLASNSTPGMGANINTNVVNMGSNFMQFNPLPLGYQNQFLQGQPPVQSSHLSVSELSPRLQQEQTQQHGDPSLQQGQGSFQHQKQQKESSSKNKLVRQPTDHQWQQSQMMQKITAQRPFIQYPQPGSNPSEANGQSKTEKAPMQIKFGPILGYDPSKNNKGAPPKSQSSKNSRVTMYDPEKNQVS